MGSHMYKEWQESRSDREQAHGKGAVRQQPHPLFPAHLGQTTVKCPAYQAAEHTIISSLPCHLL